MGKKPIFSVTYENERISIKKQLTLLKMCVTSLLWGPQTDLWPLYGFLCKRFSLCLRADVSYFLCCTSARRQFSLCTKVNNADARRCSYFELGLPVV